MVFSETSKEHFCHLQPVLDQLRKHRLKLKLPKYQFLREEAKYLGVVLIGDEIKPNMDKMEVIRAK